MKALLKKLTLLIAFLLLDKCLLAGYYSKTVSSGTTTINFYTKSGKLTTGTGLTATKYDGIENIEVTGGTLNIIFHTSHTVPLKGRFHVTKGTLNISIADDCSSSPTIMMESGNTGNAMLYVRAASSSSLPTVTITGKSAKNFHVSGAANMTVTCDKHQDASTWKATNSGRTAAIPLVYLNGCNCTMDYVKLSDNYGVWSGSTSESSDRGGAIMSSSSKGKSNITMNHCTIERCYSNTDGSAILLAGETNLDNFKLTDCTVTGCFASGNYYASIAGHGGTIKTFVSGNTNLIMTDCTMTNNISCSSGGAIWYATAIADQGAVLTRCTFKNNIAGASGGAIFVSNAVFTGCKLENNYAKVGGGGLAFSVFSHMPATAAPNFDHLQTKMKNFTVTLDSDTEIVGNEAEEKGGGIFLHVRPMNVHGTDYFTIFQNNQGKQLEVSLVVDGATIKDNKAGQGGAISIFKNTSLYISNFTVKSGKIFNNYSTIRGGAAELRSNDSASYYGTPPFPAQVMNISFGEESGKGELLIQQNRSDDIGGGFYIEGVEDALCKVDIYDGTFGGSDANANKATNGNGGCFYVWNGDVTVKGGTISNNKASNGDGGAIYLTRGKYTVLGGTISSNTALNGGGVYVNDGLFSISGGASISSNTANANGGGFYVDGGETEVSNCSILGNGAADNGGGGFVANGKLTINDGDIDNNTATNGGGFYMNGGLLDLYGGTIGQTYGNTATDKGGGFFLQGGTAYIKKLDATSLTSSKVQHNKAKYGGGLYMEGLSSTNQAKAYFDDGIIQDNTAGYNSEVGNGGGICLANHALLYMSGESAITGNRVPANGHGGGVYKANGTNTMLWVSGKKLEIVNNYAGTPTNQVRNNAYLNSYNDYITIDPDAGLGNPDDYTDPTVSLKIGISVNVNDPKVDLPTPVLYSSTSNNLNNLFYMLKNPRTGNGVFDDASLYSVVYQSSPSPFNSNMIFFVGTWTSVVTNKPDGYSSTNIDSPEDLAWFINIVNGMEGMDAHPSENGILTADIDMTFNDWTPIGEWNHKDPAYNLPDTDPNHKEKPIYTGIFEGNGHTVTGLHTRGVIGNYNCGLFGSTKDATISNVVLADCDFTSGETARMGNLIGEMNGGSVSNCIVSGSLNPSGTETLEVGDEHYCVVGGLIGEVKGESTILNCIATEEINATFKTGEIYELSQAYTVGGLVGMTSNKTVIKNCFANPLIKHSGMPADGSGDDVSRYVGGLIGENYGKVYNSYVRLERTSTLDNGKSKFGMFAGLNDANATIKHCFYPNEDLRHANITSYGADLYYSGHEEGVSEGHGQYNAVVRPYTYEGYKLDNQVSLDGGSGYGTTESTTLLNYLNDWVGNQTGYSHWMRTKASDVNGDYPVLSYDNLTGTLNYTTVGSKDGIRLEYDNSFNDICGRFVTAGNTGCLFVYKTPWTGTISSPSSEIINADNSGTGIKVFIEDGVALLQDGTSKLYNTYTCHEFSDASRSWHLISSSLKGKSPIGFNYADHSAYNNNQNPCGASIKEGAYASFFPQGITMADLDLYCFYEKEYHWINFKRRTDSHWHMNDQHQNIVYENESNLVPGKGYLASFAGRTLLQAGGELNNGDVFVPVTVDAGSLNASAQPTPIPAEQGTELKGYNLLANPYQSYLDLSEFLTVNSGLFSGSSKSGALIPTYAVYDPEKDAYIQGIASTPSRGSYAPTGTLGMHEGFFIVAANSGKDAKFTNGMRLDKAASSAKRAEQPAYPLVNLMVADASGESDIAVVEFGRPQVEGAAKMMNIGANGKVYFHYNGDDCAMLYLDDATDRLPVHFDALEDGTYTMTWSTANATFSYLHLIDNMTGIDVDMLSSDGYTFTAGTTDYKSRFKLMFAYTGVEENGAAETETFAFMHDGALTVNGEGMLEVIDMNGRTIVSRRLTDAQNTVSLPQAAQGVYVLKLTGDNVKVQKIVIE